MNILSKVTLKMLLKNKVRTIVTIIGIALSAAMICAVTTFVSSLYNYALQNAVYTEGDWHSCGINITEEKRIEITSDKSIDSYVYANQLGYADISSQNEYKPYLYVLGASSGFQNTMPIHLIEGRMPENNSEILLPDHLLSNGGVNYTIGDIVTLEIGNRINEGEKLWQNTPFYIYDKNGNTVPLGEELLIKEIRKYTVVGFYERPSFEPYTAPGYTAITTLDATSWADSLYSVWFKMKNPKNTYSFTEAIGKETTIVLNSNVLRYSGVSRYEGFNNMITGLAIIVIALIMFGSVSLIYNAFSISVSERTKQFGLLSSVGATKKQLKHMVLFEALTVGSVGIPIGITTGIFGIGITLLFIGSKFETLMNYPIPLRLKVSPLSIVIAIAVSFITVLISAFIPSRRATKVSAVSAIRLNSDIKTTAKTIKTSRLTYKLFGLSGILASKHYKRNKKKYRTTVVSLFMSIVLFVSASAFTDYLTESVSGTFSTAGFDLIYSNHNDSQAVAQRDKLLEAFADDAAVTEVSYAQSNSYNAEIDNSLLTSEAKKYSQEYSQTKTSVHINIHFVDSNSFNQLLKENGLSEKEFYNPDSPKAIIIDCNTYFDKTTEKYVSYNMLEKEKVTIKVPILSEKEGYYYYGAVERKGITYYRHYSTEESGEFIDLPYSEAFDIIELSAGKRINERPFFVQTTVGITFIYPDTVRDSILTSLPVTTPSYYYYFTSSDHSESYAAIERTLAEMNIQKGSIFNYAENVEANRNTVIIIKVFSFGFIVLISLIAAANVFNTISTNISLRRREFAMLKSIGMTQKGFNKMLNFECLLYGLRSIMWGLPVSVIITYFIYLTVQEGYSTGFRLPLTSIGIAVFSVFAVVFATMMYSMQKIKKDNPIDTLKNENI